MIFLLIASSAVSLVVAIFLIRQSRLHGSTYGEKPQRFHSGHIPRIGGAGIFVGLMVGWLLAAVMTFFQNSLNVNVSWSFSLSWVIILLPAVLGGIFEDLTQSLSVRYRMLLTAVSAVLACTLLDLSVQRLGILAVDQFLVFFPMVGGLFAFVAICGLPHAFNIIDGYNGLAGTVALFVCIAIVHVALQLGDRQLAAMVVCLVGATAGFLFWNYPRGMIFAGDGGAYLWGLVIAIASIMIVQRHEQVSPWFPMLLLIYPVWETVFSIYRKLARGGSPGVADALHFHQLIYRRIVRGVFHDDVSRRMLMRNNRTSPYLWGFTLLTVVPAIMFWNNTSVLIGFCMLFVLSYVGAYIAIIRFKVPKWLRR